ncbi:MAG: PP2C family serine/threonine-protein phosphatase [Caldimonas sp.]
MASAAGTSHKASGLPCQDSHCHLTATDRAGRPVAIFVVSDGAGSASHAAIGSTLTCQTFAKLVADYISGGGEVAKITRELALRWIAGVAYRLSLKSWDDQMELRDYSCTLLAAICGEAETAFLQIGDGAIVISDGWTTAWRYVFWPQHGEFANTTNFITSEDALEVLEFRVTGDPVAEVALFSDGLENLVLQKSDKTVHSPFFESMFPSVRQSSACGEDAALSRALEVYLSTPTVNDRTNDDKTLILATRR